MSLIIPDNPEQRVAVIGQADERTFVLRTTNEGILRVAPTPTVKSERDATTNNSDKSFTVPPGKLWHLHAVFVEFSATATAGNRIIYLDIHDNDGNVVQRYRLGLAITANAVRSWTFAPAVTEDPSVEGQAVMQPMNSQLYMPAGWRVRVYDTNAIDAAADDMTVAITYSEDTA